MNPTTRKILSSVPARFAGRYNGASYLCNLAPVGMDGNGSEMISATDDRTFETTKGNWVDGGNHSAARSTTDKKSGTASLAITSTAAGNAVSNNISLAGVNFGDILGNELLANPTLDAGITSWNGSTETTISAETTTKRTGAGSLKCVFGASGNMWFYATGVNDASTSQVLGKIYIYIPSATVARTVSVYLYSQAWAALGLTTVTISPDTWTEINVSALLPGTQTSVILFVSLASPTNGDIIYADDASLKKVTTQSLVLNSKYTVEVPARGTGILGNNILAGDDTNFGSSIGSWTGIRTTTTWDTDHAKSIVTANDFGPIGLTRSAGITAGRTYFITFKAKSPTITRPFTFFGGSGLTPGTAKTNPNLTTSYQLYEGWMAGSGVNFVIGLNTTGVSINDEIDFDDITIQEITLPTITLALGSKSQATASVSCVPGTFTKCVFNFQATVAEIGQPLKIFANQADVVYVDEIGLAQAFDMIVVSIINNLSEAGGFSRAIWSMANGAGVAPYWFGVQTSGNTLRTTLNDGVTNVNISGTTSLITSGVKVVISVLDRTGNGSQYFNGVIEAGTGSITALGKLTGNRFQLGAAVNLVNILAGMEGEFQCVRFTSLGAAYAANIVAQISATKKCLPSYINQVPGGIWCDFKAGSLRDKSGNGNHLSVGAGSVPIVRI